MKKTYAIIVFSLIAILLNGQDKHCGPTMLMAPEICELTTLNSSNDTIWAIIDKVDCSPNPKKCADGYWRIYSLDTLNIIAEYQVSNGLINGVYTTRHPNGKLSRRQTWVKGEVNGTTLSLDENGRIVSIGSYDSHIFTGSQYTYWDNGMIAKSTTYTDDSLSSIYFNMEGEVINEKLWKELWNCP